MKKWQTLDLGLDLTLWIPSRLQTLPPIHWRSHLHLHLDLHLLVEETLDPTPPLAPSQQQACSQHTLNCPAEVCLGLAVLCLPAVPSLLSQAR